MVCDTDTDNMPSILNQKQGSLTGITFKISVVGQITSDMHMREGTHRAPSTSGSQLAGLAANQIPCIMTRLPVGSALLSVCPTSFASPVLEGLRDKKVNAGG